MKGFRKIVVASDSFKGSMSSLDVAVAAKSAIESLCPGCETVMVPVADGGEGTAEAVTLACGGTTRTIAASDPLGRIVEASYGVIDGGKTAVIDTASASGLPLLSRLELNPLKASTFGTGELILDAVRSGCTTVLVGLGGSATNDGGMGMLCALGYRFLDADGNALPGCGESLEKVVSIDASSVPSEVGNTRFRVACDVDTPFCGPDGASEVFAPQKGADSAMVKRLDAGMTSFASVIEKHTGTDISRMEGTGAAGGLGGAFRAFLGAELLPGIEMVLEAVGFDGRLDGADLVITGEGKMDSQTLKGKTPYGILSHAKAAGIPVAAMCGKCLDRDTLLDAGFLRIDEIAPAGMTLEQMMEPSTAKNNVRNTVKRIILEL